MNCYCFTNIIRCMSICRVSRWRVGSLSLCLLATHPGELVPRPTQTV